MATLVIYDGDLPRLKALRKPTPGKARDMESMASVVHRLIDDNPEVHSLEAKMKKGG